MSRSGPGRCRASSPTAGCGRCSRRWRSTGSTARAQSLRAVPGRHRCDGPRRRRPGGAASARRAPAAAGPTAVGADAADRRRAARRADVASRRGHSHRHPAGPGNRLRPGRRPLVGDPRRRRRPPHLQPGARLSRRRSRHRLRQVDRRAAHRVEFGVGFHRAAQCGARGQPGRGHRRRLVDQLGVQRAAVRRRSMAAGRLRSPRHQRDHHDHAERHRRRRADPPDRGVHRQRHQHAAFRRSRQGIDGGAALRRDTVGANHRRGHRRRITRRPVRHHRLHRHPVRRVRLRPPGGPASHRARTRAATEFRCRTVGSGLRAAGQIRLRR